MDRRFLTVLGASLVFALVITSIFYQMTARAGGPKKTDQPETRDIVLAARPLGVGASVKSADVKIGKIVASAFPKGAFSRIEEVQDRPVISNILLDEPVLEGRLAVRGSGMGLAPIIPVGYRAVTVRVNDVTSVAGFVLPGMRVDVLVTGRPPTMNDTVTTTCLQKMLVLSSGTTIQADGKGQALPSPSVTLLAKPDEAEILTLANSEGRIQLILRNGGDEETSKTGGKEVSELYGGRSHRAAGPTTARVRPRPAAPAMAPAPPPPPPEQVVVIRGTQKTVEVIGNNRPSDGGKP